MTARMRSRVTVASLPFQIRQRRTSATITALAFSRSAVSAGRVLAVFSACCRRMAMRNQSRYGGLVMLALTRIERSPEQPSVNAVSSVSGVWPTSLRPRRINVSIAVLATAAKTWRAPFAVSTLPSSRCRWPSSQLRMKVESRVRVIAEAATAGLVAAVGTV